MAILEDVEVFIKSTATGERLVEYDNPDPEDEAGSLQVEKFVEAQSEAEFQVVVNLKAGFDYHGADGVRVRLVLDGGAVRRHWYKCKSELVPINDKLLEDKSFSFATVSSKRGEDWIRVAFSFGKVDVGEY